MHHLHRAARPAARGISVAFGLMMFAIASSNLSAQDAKPAAQAQTGAALPGSTVAADPLISIDVVVSDKLGHPVRGLQAQDFSVFDNKQSQKLRSFRAFDASASPAEPVHVVIVVDTINTSFLTVSRDREQLGEFLKRDGGRLAQPTSLAFFADSGVKVQQASTLDGNELLASFENTQSELRAIGRDTGFWGAAERLQMSLEQLQQLAAYEAAKPGRKLIIIISPGWPMLPWATVDATTQERQWIFNSIVEFSNGLRAARVTLYSIDPFELGRTDPFYYQSYLKGVTSLSQGDIPDLALQVMAEHSGGLAVDAWNDIAGGLTKSVRDANAYYTLTFDAAPGTHPNEYHELQVQVDKPGLKVRTTAGYYAHPQVLGKTKKH